MGIVANLLPSRARKAETGIGAVMMRTNPPLSIFSKTPQSMMRDAQAVAVSDITIRAAERVIANRFSSTDWHLEDENDVEVGDGEGENNNPAYLAVKSLLEKPYRPAPGDPQSTSPRTWASLSNVTCRHMGLCGSAFWYLDQSDALAGTPLQILYINPARMTPVLDKDGAITDWVLDHDNRGGGMPLGLANVIHFQLEPPDEGVFPAGLVETALSKVEMTKLSDRHVTMTLAAGGRLSGIMSPKEGFLEDQVYSQLVRDIRTISEAPDAAKRMLILRGPVEYKEAAASLSDLDLAALNTLTRDDKLALWGVPHSSLGIPTAGGLGGGTSKDADEAILWQNAVNPRLRVLAETVQYLLLDRFATLGVNVEIEFETPEFDDEMPMFDMATKAANLPLTNRERRDLIGLDPFGDERDEEVWLPAGLAPAYSIAAATLPPGTRTLATEIEDPFDDDVSLYGKAVDVPAYVQSAARRGLRYYEQGRGGEGLVPATIAAAREMAAGSVSEAKVRRIGPWIARHIVDLDAPQNSDPEHPDYPGPGAVAMLLWGAGTTPAQARRTQQWAEAAAAAMEPEKAKVSGTRRIRQDVVDAMKRDLADVIAGLMAETARKVEKNYDHIVTRPDDASAYWSDERAEKRLIAAMTPHIRELVRDTVDLTQTRFAKAGILDIILPRLVALAGRQIKTVPATLLKSVRTAIADGIRDGLSPRDLGKLIEERIGNNEYYAERIARTESMRILNQAQMESYRESGITQVIAVDGDDDDECAERNGRMYTLAEAEAENLLEHPNGTLSWDPVTDFRLLDPGTGQVMGPAKAQQEEQPMGLKATMDSIAIHLAPVINVEMPEQKAHVVNVSVPEAPAPIINVTPQAAIVNVEQPDVIVNVPEQKAGLVQDIRIIDMPDRRLSQVVVRDGQGRIVGTESATD
jgi:SPP1 gp7 family putative phage head morphogenesis protein